MPDALNVCVIPTHTNAPWTARHACVCGILVGRARGAAYADGVARGFALRLGSKPWCAARAHTCREGSAAAARRARTSGSPRPLVGEMRRYREGDRLGGGGGEPALDRRQQRELVCVRAELLGPDHAVVPSRRRCTVERQWDNGRCRVRVALSRFAARLRANGLTRCRSASRMRWPLARADPAQRARCGSRWREAPTASTRSGCAWRTCARLPILAHWALADAVWPPC